MSVYLNRLLSDIDHTVPPQATHIGLIIFCCFGTVKMVRPSDGMGLTLPRLPRVEGDPPSRTVEKIYSMKVITDSRTLFSLPYLWHTSHSTTFYFTGVTKPGASYIGEDSWLTIPEAMKEIGQRMDKSSRARDLVALEAAVALNPCSYRRILHMVRELHRMGYERLRIFPTNGTYWNCAIVPKHWTLRHNGALLSRYATQFPLSSQRAGIYEGLTEQQPFGWADAAFQSPEELARHFLIRFPEMTVAGWGKDPEYALWLSRLLEDLAPFGLPSVGDASQPESDRLHVRFHPTLRSFPLPPPGEADE